ncbi:MAG: lactoylglutathione lyase [Ignavibacteria bacterium]|nr:lactoylglutathione lyase [Ignavibacteria bacterium]
MILPDVEIILYVEDQARSRELYAAMLGLVPTLDVPGMTEFTLSDRVKLGLMLNSGIAKILGDTLPHPQSGTGIPRCELYLKVSDVDQAYSNALSAGARSVSEPARRSWGDVVCYVADYDGHIIAFAALAVTD